MMKQLKNSTKDTKSRKAYGKQKDWRMKMLANFLKGSGE